MKFIIPIIMLTLSICYGADQKEVDAKADHTVLNKFIDRSIELNNELTKLLTEEAKDLDNKEIIIPLEKKTGAAWDAYLKYVKQSNDRKLKIITLEVELNQELLNAYYEADILEADVVKKNIAEAKKNLALLEIEKNK